MTSLATQQPAYETMEMTDVPGGTLRAYRPS